MLICNIPQAEMSTRIIADKWGCGQSTRLQAYYEARRQQPQVVNGQGDILVIPSLALAQEHPDGSRAVRTERICFDFAVVNVLGPSHWARTAAQCGGAAEDYDTHKRRHNHTRGSLQGTRLEVLAGRV